MNYVKLLMQYSQQSSSFSEICSPYGALLPLCVVSKHWNSKHSTAHTRDSYFWNTDLIWPIHRLKSGGFTGIIYGHLNHTYNVCKCQIKKYPQYICKPLYTHFLTMFLYVIMLYWSWLFEATHLLTSCCDCTLTVRNFDTTAIF